MAPDATSTLPEAGTPGLVWALLVVVLTLVAAASAVRVVDAGERAVVIRLGRACRVGGPGLVVHVPGLERVRIVSTSPTSICASFTGSTKEGIRVRLYVDVLYQIVDPVAVVGHPAPPATWIIDHLERVIHHAMAGATLPQLLLRRELLAARVQDAATRLSLASGVRVVDVEITTVEMELCREVLRWVR